VPIVRRALRLSLSLLLLAAVAAALWWAWMGWDEEYYTDPATGPYRPWQVIGCVLSLVVVAVLDAGWSTASSWAWP